MNGPQSYSEAARLLDGLAEWTSKINAETPLEEGELSEGILTALVAFGHAMQANTAAVLTGRPLTVFQQREWRDALAEEDRP